MSESTPDTGTQNTEPERDNPSKANTQTAPPAEGDTAPTEHVPGGSSDASGSVPGSPGSASGGDDDPGVITDDQLPEDLQATDDNPLAQPADPDDEDQGMSLGQDGPQP